MILENKRHLVKYDIFSADKEIVNNNIVRLLLLLLLRVSVVVFFVVEPLPAVPGQNQPQLWSPVVAGHHRLHLTTNTQRSQSADNEGGGGGGSPHWTGQHSPAQT